MGHHIEDLLGHWHQAPHEAWVLAVITDIQGSAYRKPGAIMLFNSVGKSFGLLSGGCLEADLRRHAQKALQTMAVQRVIYDATDESDTSYQLGCGGIVSIMLVPLIESNQCLGLAALMQGLADNTHGFYQVSVCEQGTDAANVVGTFTAKSQATFPLSDFDRVGYLDTNTLNTDRHNADFPNSAAAPLTPSSVSLVIPMRSKYHLGVFGGGIDAQPLVSMALTLGWRVTVFDERSAYGRDYDFPGASVVRRASNTLNEADLNCLDAVMVMHHNVVLDAKALVRLQSTQIAYVGLLGPGHRRDKVLALAKLEQGDFQHRLFAPAGLALGGELPTSIALSILSQCHGVLHQAALSELTNIMK